MSDDFKFAASIAMLGQLLKESDYKEDTSSGKVVTLANSGLANDRYGYKKEFERLVESVKRLH